MKSMKIGLSVLIILVCSAAPLLAESEQILAGVELQAMADTFQYALENNPTEEAADWVNPDTSRSGSVVPTRTFENAQGQPCREFVTTIIIAGQEEQGYGTACRQPDGNWTLVSEASQSVPQRPNVRTRTYVTPPPAAYYSYPYGFFGPYRIYLSFGSVYRSGRLHLGSRYLDGRSFRSRNPIVVRNRVNIGTRIAYRYRLHDELNYREWDRRSRYEYNKRHVRTKRSGKDWREKRRDDRRDEKRDRKERRD